MMSENKEGFSVEVSIRCFGPDGKVWTAAPAQWFGFENEYSMNQFSNGCSIAVSQFLAQANEEKYGKGKPPHAG